MVVNGPSDETLAALHPLTQWLSANSNSSYRGATVVSTLRHKTLAEWGVLALCQGAYRDATRESATSGSPKVGDQPLSMNRYTILVMILMTGCTSTPSRLYHETDRSPWEFRCVERMAQAKLVGGIWVDMFFQARDQESGRNFFTPFWCRP